MSELISSSGSLSAMITRRGRSRAKLRMLRLVGWVQVLLRFSTVRICTDRAEELALVAEVSLKRLCRLSPTGKARHRQIHQLAVQLVVGVDLAASLAIGIG
jgi:hypothetical protein